MKVDVISIGDAARALADAIARDRDAGLLPPWIGAVIVTTRQMIFISKRRWSAVQVEEQIARN